MIGIIILISLLICALCLLIALLYIRQTEIEVKDKSVDLESVLPIQTITENAVINGNGDITVGYRCFCPKCSPCRKARRNTSMSGWRLF